MTMKDVPTTPAATHRELRLGQPRALVALRLLRPVYVAAGLIGYGLILGGSGMWLALLAGLITVTFAWPIVAAVASLFAQLPGPEPALTAEGIRLRVRPWRRGCSRCARRPTIR